MTNENSESEATARELTNLTNREVQRKTKKQINRAVLALVILLTTLILAFVIVGGRTILNAQRVEESCEQSNDTRDTVADVINILIPERIREILRPEQQQRLERAFKRLELKSC